MFGRRCITILVIINCIHLILNIPIAEIEGEQTLEGFHKHLIEVGVRQLLLNLDDTRHKLMDAAHCFLGDRVVPVA